MKKIALLLLACSLWLHAGLTQSQITPTMKEKIQAVTDLLQSKTLNAEEVSEYVFNEFGPVFDFALMARLSLGASQWRALSTKEQDEYTEKFIARLKRSFMEKLNLYSDEIAVIKGTEEAQIGPSTRLYLLTELIGKEDNYSVVYKFYDAKEKGWMIYDVDILDVSVVQTYRSQFDGFLKDNSFRALIDWLQADKTP
jgi:phospholipid transport system substrate-binding protein